MTNLVVILDDVEMHMLMIKCLYRTVLTINIHTCVSVKKNRITESLRLRHLRSPILYIYLNIHIYRKVLNT